MHRVDSQSLWNSKAELVHELPDVYDVEHGSGLLAYVLLRRDGDDP